MKSLQPLPQELTTLIKNFQQLQQELTALEATASEISTGAFKCHPAPFVLDTATIKSKLDHHKRQTGKCASSG
jgi:hypothetical protein